MMVRRKASDEGDPSSLDQDKHNSTTVMLEEERHARPTVSLGLSTWEAVLNELLELRNSDLIKSTTTAYNLLQSVEETVLPTWKEEGRSLLSAAGLDHGQLRKTGMREETIEKLYLGLYAFSFGFGTIARQAIEGVREKEHRRELVLQISQVFSTLTGEALDAENHDLISEMMEEKDRRIADLDREKTILDRRVKTVNEEIAFAHHMSNKAHAERIAAAAKAEAEISEQLMTIRQLEQAVAGLSSRVRELEEETGVLRGDLERLEGENKEMSEEREQTRSKHLSEKKALTSELYAARNEAQTASKSLHDLSVRHATLSRVNGKIDEELKSVRLQLEEEGKEKEELLMERTRALETITHLEQEAARQAALQQQELDRLRAEKERTEKLMNEMIDRLKLTGKEAEEEVLRLSTSVRKMEEEVEERKKKEAELSEELDMVCANVAVLRNSLRSEEEERKRWKQEAEDKAGALKGLQEEHKNLQRAHRRKEEEAEATGKALSLARKEAAKLEEERRRATEELAREIVQHEVSRVDGAMKLESSHSSRMLLVRNTLQRTSEQRASRMMSFFSFHLQNKEEGEGGEGREGEAERKGGLVSGLEREQKEKEEEKEERAGDKEVSSPIRSPAPSPRADLK
ncbi:hypothetical protein GUITHDRAFT_145076 [Guillardia theta CCMP2712]|uniref:Uncharacterized protein n=1 Tax=Guillardia theta (strain CCMP2712) TaxID=905079 RepID=L1INJ7_GUITC|nr:hypothetical protein GUITHDRAFT_145076 [Guillardia theta CCMP2712]EKX37380.1 hypothetical protein GUITHDRAFT_145076 [Guillardia theta CCMP2712]|eukprot:XP_005824360.1 hypothetical protein GUITHDRAFT_145076 [Guillardia theta CCMP2712]